MHGEASGQPAAHPLAVAVRLLRADAPEQIMGAPENWPRWAVLLPQGRDRSCQPRR
jgi:hypothetical protein